MARFDQLDARMAQMTSAQISLVSSIQATLPVDVHEYMSWSLAANTVYSFATGNLLTWHAAVTNPVRITSLLVIVPEDSNSATIQLADVQIPFQNTVFPFSPMKLNLLSGSIRSLTVSTGTLAGQAMVLLMGDQLPALGMMS